MKKRAFDLYFNYSDLGKLVIKQGNAIKRLVYRNGIYVNVQATLLL